MQLYHGSINKFKQFDYAKIRTNGTSEGIGFYFTDSKKVATSYATQGYLYTVDFNGNKALSDNKLTLTKEEVKRLVIALYDCDGSILPDYGDLTFSGYENVLSEAINNIYNYNGTDTEIIGSLYNQCGESEKVLTLLYGVLGYDHIISVPDWGKQTLYIALTNDIITIKEVEKHG